MCGNFYGIGVGPGDPELMTVKAARILAETEVVIAPKTEKKDGSVALDIAKRYINPKAEIIYQTFIMKKGFADYPDGWQENARQIMSYLQKGKTVAFLTLGDPMLYSTYIYVYRLLKEQGTNIATVPGINSFAAIAANAGRPLVEGDDILTIIPATAPEEKIAGALANADNAVLMKVYHNFSAVVDMLKKADMDKDAVMISRCGMSDEEIIDDIFSRRQEPVNYLSTILARKNRE